MNRQQQSRRDKEIVRRVKAGEKPSAIAGDYQLSRQAIYVILQRSGHALERKWVTSK